MVKLESVLQFAAGDERYERINAFPVTVYAKDGTGRYLAGNHCISRLAGLSSVSDLLDKTDRELCWGASFDTLIANDHEVMDRGEALFRIEPVVDALGHAVNMLSLKLPVQNLAAECVGVLGISLNPLDYKATDFFDMVAQIAQSFGAKQDLPQFTMADRAPVVDTREILLKRLTPREQDCVRCLVKGMSAKETAQVLNLSYRTIEVYFEKIKSKLGVHKKTEILSLLYDSETSLP